MFRGIIILILMLPLLTFGSVNDFDRQQIIERIEPVGHVRVEDPGAAAAPEETQTVAKKEEKKSPGQAIYEQYCAVCHRSGLAGAPKSHVKADWKARLDQKKLNGLVGSAIKGLNAMPPKGTCQECSESDIKNAITYMLPKS